MIKAVAVGISILASLLTASAAAASANEAGTAGTAGALGVPEALGAAGAADLPDALGAAGAADLPDALGAAGAADLPDALEAADSADLPGVAGPSGASGPSDAAGLSEASSLSGASGLSDDPGSALPDAPRLADAPACGSRRPQLLVAVPSRRSLMRPVRDMTTWAGRSSTCPIIQVDKAARPGLTTAMKELLVSQTVRLDERHEGTKGLLELRGRRHSTDVCGTAHCDDHYGQYLPIVAMSQTTST